MKNSFRNVIVIDDESLHKLNVRPPLVLYLKQLWRRRYFVWAEARSKAFAAGRDTFLGRLWLVLDPLFQVSVYALVFGMILHVTRGMENFVGFLVLGVIFFGFISKGINGGANLIQRSRNVISAFSFPRATIVLSSVVRQMLDNMPPALIAVVVALLFQPHHPLNAQVLLAIPLFIVLHIFILGVEFWVAKLTAFVPDLKSFFSLFTRGLFFISGIFFTIDRFDTHPALRSLVELNPAYQFLMAIRACVLDGRSPSFFTWWYLIIWSLTLLITGFVFFWRSEERYAQIK